MIRKFEDMKITKAQDFKGGKGTLTLRHLLEADEQHGASRLFALVCLDEGGLLL